MFRSFVTAALLLAVTACPFRCAVGADACGGASDEAAHCRCCPAASNDRSDDSQKPADAPDRGGCQCQGVCGGAVLPDQPELDRTAAATGFVPATANVVSLRVPAGSVRVVRRENKPDKPGGLALRIRLSSLLN